MGGKQESRKDHWSSEKYKASASFVPNLASQILKWLDPQPTDRILDIGCGDGKFTAHFIPAITSPDGEIHGIDSSAQFIREANEAYGTANNTNTNNDGDKPKISFSVLDAQNLSSNDSITNGTWDKVISNAALHWILCTKDAGVREKVFRDIYSSLKSNGKSMFVFEFGGAGNVAEIVTATVAILRRDGFDVQQIRDEIIPWFFPDVSWVKSVLEKVGFRVDVCELVDRPTRLNEVQTDQDGKFVGGGVEGWVRLMMAGIVDSYVAKMGDGSKEKFIREVTEAVEYVADKSFDGQGEGGMWLQYVRLRGIATKI